MFTARTEFRQWLTQPKILSVGVLMIFIYQLVIIPLSNRADRLGKPLNRIEPFFAVCNSSEVILLIPFVFLILFSDYPRISSNSMMVLCRTGKRSWLTGQLLFAVGSVLAYLLFLLFGSMLACPGILSWNWSDAVTKYEAAFPDEAGSFDSLLVPSHLYNQMPLYKAFLLSALWLFCYLVLLILIQYFFRLLYLDSLGLLAEVFVIAGGVLTCALRTKWMWLFPMAHTIPWLHFEEILRKPVMPVWASNLYWGVLTAFFGCGCYINVKKYEFR